MNEPSVFDVDEKTMPLSEVQHYGNWLHRDVHNAYGFYQTMGTYEGLLARSDEKLRPFILTRSHFAGSQRYTAMWTGDNNADWNYLRISVPMCLTEALAGISFCGADVGGFNNDVEDELFQRWYQTGAWLPFFRSHASKGTKRREPYLYPVDIQERLRTALKQRYVHLPYWYTLWWEHARTGTPVIRPLSYHFSETNVLDVDQEWLVGGSILVSPVMEKSVKEIKIVLPGDVIWYYIDANTTYNGGQTITLPVDITTVPVFYKGGSVIPRKDTIRSSSVYTHKDPFSLYVMVDGNGKAEGTLYIDDYQSFDYKNKSYLYIKIDYIKDVLTYTKIDEDADYTTEEVVDKIYCYGETSKRRAILLIGKERKQLETKYDNENKCLELVNLNINAGKSFQISFE